MSESQNAEVPLPTDTLTLSSTELGNESVNKVIKFSLFNQKIDSFEQIVRERHDAEVAGVHPMSSS